MGKQGKISKDKGRKGQNRAIDETAEYIRQQSAAGMAQTCGAAVNSTLYF